MRFPISRPYLIGALAAGAGFAAAMARRSGPTFHWPGKVVLITGGSRGLGFGLAWELAKKGANVVICGRDQSQLDAAESSLRQITDQVVAVQCDVSDPEQVENLIGVTLQHFERIDVLVNNAGTIKVGPYHTLTIDDFETAMKIIYWGTVYTTLAALPHMLARSTGRVVNITSIGGKVSIPHLLPYSCAKFAAVAFSEGLRSELHGTGVTTVTIAPGLMRTGSFINSRFKGDNENEAAWFGVSASLPGLSMSGKRAVDQIIRATARGRAEKVLSQPAQLLSLFHGLWPGLTADALGLANQMLPAGHGNADRIIGPHIRKSKVLDSLTVLGQRAARIYMQETCERQAL